MNHKNIDDEFRSGDEKAFTALYHRFRKPIFRYVSWKVRDSEAAEEVTQDIFFKAFRFRESYRPGFAFSTWLWTIARNSISDWLRKHSDRLNSANESDEENVASPEDIPTLLNNAETLMSAKHERRRLLKVARSLSRLQRRALWLRAVHHLSYDEIARRLGLSLASVKNLIYRQKSH